MSASSSAPTSPVSKPAFIRHRSRSVCLERTSKPYKRYIHDPDNWHRLFTSFNNRSNLKQKLKAWVKENAPGVRYTTFHSRYKTWTDAGQPEPPPPLPSHINRSLSSPPCTIPGLGDGRGGHNRKWTREQEEQFAEVAVKPAVE